MPKSKTNTAAAGKIPKVQKKALIQMLDAASVQYTHGDNFGRDGMISALNVAVAVLTIHLPVSKTKRRRLLRPLMTLTRGLREINNGNPPKFAKSEKRFSGVRFDPVRLTTMGIAAGAFKVLSQTNKITAARTAELVSKVLKNQKFLLEGGDPVSLRALRLWQTQARKSPDTPNGKSYKALVDAGFSSDNFEELKSEILDLVRSHAVKFRAGDS